jgi:hypothetical protein
LSPRGIWATLGIAQTQDRVQIRRAYAARLKDVHPEDDAVGFQALRAAYEQALAYAARGVQVHFAPSLEEPAPEPPEPPAPPPRIVLEPPPDPAPLPPHLPPPAAPIEPPPAAPSDVDRHRMSCTRLARIVSRSVDVDRTLLAGLIDEVLNGPAMDQIGVFIRTEPMIAHLIAANIPRSDPLVAPAIARFGWVVDGRQREADPGVAAVLARQVDLDYLTKLKRRDNPLREAAAMLQAPPGPGEAMRGLIRLGRLDNLRTLLAEIRRNHPGLLRNFPADVVDAWTDYLAAPRISSSSFWIAIGLASGIALITSAGAGRGGDGGIPPTFFLAWPAWTAAAVGALVLKLLAIDIPRRLWRRRWAALAPAWLGLGWGPASLTVLALSVVLPLTIRAPVPVWSWAIFAAVSSVVALWAGITGDAYDSNASSWPWVIRNTVRNLPLGALWVIILARATVLGAEPQVAIAVAGCALAYGLAEQTLADLWLAAGQPTRRWVLLALTLVSLALLVPIFVSESAHGLQPLAFPLAAAISAAAVLQRVPASTAKRFVFPTINLGSNPFRIIWLLLILGPVVTGGAAIVLSLAALLAPWWVAGGVVVNLISVLRREGWPRWRETPTS